MVHFLLFSFFCIHFCGMHVFLYAFFVNIFVVSMRILFINRIVSCIGVCYTHVVLVTFCLILCDKRCCKHVFCKVLFLYFFVV